jgi:hypothetical protein
VPSPSPDLIPGYNRISLDSLSEAQLDRLLDNLVSVPELDEYGISMVLNWAVDNRSAAAIRFIKKRIVRASERRGAQDWSYRIGHTGLFPVTKLRFTCMASAIQASSLDYALWY